MTSPYSSPATTPAATAHAGSIRPAPGVLLADACLNWPIHTAAGRFVARIPLQVVPHACWGAE